MNNEQNICAVYSSAKAIGLLPASHFTYNAQNRVYELVSAVRLALRIHDADLTVADHRVLPMLVSQGMAPRPSDRSRPSSSVD
jgi:hypothetical protein